MKFPAPPRPDLLYGPQGEVVVAEEGDMEMELGEMGEAMGVALGAYWSGSWVGEMEEE